MPTKNLCNMECALWENIRANITDAATKTICFTKNNKMYRMHNPVVERLSNQYKEFCLRISSIVHSQKFQEEIMITGIDTTSPLGTIKRTKLIEIQESFLREDEISVFRILFSNTTLDIISSISRYHHLVSSVTTSIQISLLHKVIV